MKQKIEVVAYKLGKAVPGMGASKKKAQNLLRRPLDSRSWG